MCSPVDAYSLSPLIITENGPAAMLAMWPHLMPLANHHQQQQQALFDNSCIQNQLMLSMSPTRRLSISLLEICSSPSFPFFLTTSYSSFSHDIIR